jgi:isochorismate hydrolase
MSELHLPIRPDSTALLVVDLQEKLRPVIDGREAVIENTRKLLRLAAILSMPVLATTQYEKGLGATVTGIAELLDHEPIDKVCFGCMGDAVFRQRLSAVLPPDGAVLLCGVEAHICVMQTALGMREQGLHRPSCQRRRRVEISGQRGTGKRTHAGSRRGDFVHGNGHLRIASE